MKAQRDLPLTTARAFWKRIPSARLHAPRGLRRERALRVYLRAGGTEVLILGCFGLSERFGCVFNF